MAMDGAGGAGMFRWLPDSGPDRPIPHTGLVDGIFRDTQSIERNPPFTLQYLLAQEQKLAERNAGGIYRLGRCTQMVVVSDHGLLKELLTLPYPSSTVVKTTDFNMSSQQWNARVLAESSQLPPCQFLNGLHHRVMKEELQSALKLSTEAEQDKNLEAAMTAIHEVFQSDLAGKPLKDVIFTVSLGILKKLYVENGASNLDDVTAELCDKFSSSATLLRKRYNRCPLRSSEVDTIRKLVDSTELRGHIGGKLGDSKDADSMVQAAHALVVHVLQPMRALLVNLVARWAAISDSERADMTKEVSYTFSQDAFCPVSLDGLTSVEAFVCEVLRMHPPRELFYWRTKCALGLSLAPNDRYKISADTELVGNIYTAQRKESVFAVGDMKAEDFNHQRFLQRPDLKEQLLWSHGLSSHSPQLDTHQCPAKDLVLSISKLFVSLMTGYEVTLSELPNWTSESWQPGCLPMQEGLSITTWSAREPIDAEATASLKSSIALQACQSSAARTELSAVTVREAATALFRSLNKLRTAADLPSDVQGTAVHGVHEHALATALEQRQDTMQRTLQIMERLQGKLAQAQDGIAELKEQTVPQLSRDTVELSGDVCHAEETITAAAEPTGDDSEPLEAVKEIAASQAEVEPEIHTDDSTIATAAKEISDESTATE
eukprot:scpid41283/ scgid33939/ Allene oxide synthase 3; Cytochrome P450 74A3; Hydroperoxide dehydrase 3